MSLGFTDPAGHASVSPKTKRCVSLCYTGFNGGAFHSASRTDCAGLMEAEAQRQVRSIMRGHGPEEHQSGRIRPGRHHPEEEAPLGQIQALSQAIGQSANTR